MVRHCTCGLYFTRRWLVKYKSPLVQYLAILHSTPCNNNLYIIYTLHIKVTVITKGAAALRYAHTVMERGNFARCQPEAGLADVTTAKFVSERMNPCVVL